VSDFLAKIATEILPEIPLKVLILLIERIAHSDLASNVSHAIQERAARKGIWSGVSSAIHAAVMAIWSRICSAWQAVLEEFKPSPKVTPSSGSVTLGLSGFVASASVGRLSASVAMSASVDDPDVGYPPPPPGD
jgi:hypothetical protein